MRVFAVVFVGGCSLHPPQSPVEAQSSKCQRCWDTGDRSALFAARSGRCVAVQDGNASATTSVDPGQITHRHLTLLWLPVIIAARSSGARKDGGGGGPQFISARVPSQSRAVHN